MITFHILTLFPESFPSILNVGLIGKAFQKNYSKLIQLILEITVNYLLTQWMISLLVEEQVWFFDQILSLVQ